MRKLDKLILKSFLGPFVLTFLVVVFILLTQTMMRYFDEFVGKGLGFEVFAELLFYFSINMTPVALPLAVLLSSLMTFGNLGEHFELTAIKSAGISLTRTLLPIFIFTIVLVIAAFFNNNNVVPKANLKAYSLLWDIKQKEPSLDLKEGAFYSGIPNYSMKVNKKYADGGLGDLIIYDHSKGKGNTDVIVADSGRMYTINNERYLKLDLYEGNQYSEPNGSTQQTYGPKQADEFVRNKFHKSTFIFSLASFEMKRTDEDLFSTNRLMKNVNQLTRDVDSMRRETSFLKYNLFNSSERSFTYHLKEKLTIPEELLVQRRKNTIVDTAATQKPYIEAPEYVDESIKISGNIATKDTGRTDVKAIRRYKSSKKAAVQQATKVYAPLDSVQRARLDSLINLKTSQKAAIQNALAQARYIKSNLSLSTSNYQNLKRETAVHLIEKNKKFAQAFACLVMFLIGAPLGAIIKKGGLGIPVIISIVFFIIYYVISILGEKWAKTDLIEPALGVWAANIILLPFGLIFLKQARNDVRIFETDFYNVIIARVRKRLGFNDD